MKNKTYSIFIFLFITSILLFLFALSVGLQEISFIDVLNFFFSQIKNNNQNIELILSLRIPRVMTAFFIGSLLAISGLIFQTIFKNDLATPFTLGISTASSAGAFLFILFFSNTVFSLWMGSFIGGFVEIIILLLIIYFLYSKNYTSANILQSNSNIILAGVALNFLFSAIIMITRFLANPYELSSMEIWILGTLHIFNFSIAISIAFFSIILLIIYLFFAKKLDYLLLDDNWIISKGIPIQKIKLLLLMITLIVLSYVLSHTGPIGFIGLVIPHLVKITTRETHTKLILYSFFTGGIFLMLIDLLSRTSANYSSGEIPVGLLTSLIGVPFFLFILMRKK